MAKKPKYYTDVHEKRGNNTYVFRRHYEYDSALKRNKWKKKEYLGVLTIDEDGNRIVKKSRDMQISLKESSFWDYIKAQASKSASKNEKGIITFIDRLKNRTLSEYNQSINGQSSSSTDKTVYPPAVPRTDGKRNTNRGFYYTLKSEKFYVYYEVLFDITMNTEKVSVGRQKKIKESEHIPIHLKMKDYEKLSNNIEKGILRTDYLAILPKKMEIEDKISLPFSSIFAYTNMKTITGRVPFLVKYCLIFQELLTIIENELSMQGFDNLDSIENILEKSLPFIINHIYKLVQDKPAFFDSIGAILPYIIKESRVLYDKDNAKLAF